jgi:hypothetical protein
MAVHSPNASPIVLARDFRSPVELRFHRIGRGRDLTERQGHGEDFDEDCFHSVDGLVLRCSRLRPLASPVVTLGQF